VELEGGMLCVDLMKAKDGWLWRSDRIGNKPMPIALCGSLLWMMIVAKAAWSLAPPFFWTQGIWGNLLCSGWCHCHGTYSMETFMCMGLCLDRSFGLTYPISDGTGLACARRSSNFFLVEVTQNSFLSFPEAHNHRS
jgi:hypothetical protein